MIVCRGVYGAPGSDSALETVYNNFTTALQALSTSPDAGAARTGVLTAAQALAQQLNGMSSDIQGMRSDAEAGLADSVQQANDAMQQIAQDQPAARDHRRDRRDDREPARSARQLHQANCPS